MSMAGVVTSVAAVVVQWSYSRSLDPGQLILAADANAPHGIGVVIRITIPAGDRSDWGPVWPGVVGQMPG